jgi:S-adenosylmethionine:tRNA ribosyltransferase-isomerase
MAAASVVADFEWSTDLEAAEPPEARGLRRDDVRLLVSDPASDSIEHARFADLDRFLSAGDLLVVNTSGTMNAAIRARAHDGDVFEIHFSTRLPGGFWSLEVREPEATASRPYQARAGMTFRLPEDGLLTLLAPYPLGDTIDAPSRLWIAAPQIPRDMIAYLDEHGFPIRYGYVKRSWPGSMYQTVFATETGSAEMPSAGRPFTPELVTRLVSRGIEIAPLLLHTGVSSLERHEPPYEEYFRVPHQTAERVNASRLAGHRVLAVGTTAVRALETVTDDRGVTSPGEGWTGLVIGRDRPVRSVTGLITGLHEPRASHLSLLEGVIAAAVRHAGRAADARQHLERAYGEAAACRYLWHEFGDSHLIISGGAAQPSRRDRS